MVTCSLDLLTSLVDVTCSRHLFLHSHSRLALTLTHVSHSLACVRWCIGLRALVVALQDRRQLRVLLVARMGTRSPSSLPFTECLPSTSSLRSSESLPSSECLPSVYPSLPCALRCKAQVCCVLCGVLCLLVATEQVAS